MKKNIHPAYRQVVFHDTSVDVYYQVGSTIKTERTIEYEGQTYPYIPIEVSGMSHPFYTGKQKVIHQEGRVARFNQRFSKLTGQKE